MLVPELGQRYEAQNVWHYCGDLSDITHWVLPHYSGTRYSAVAFTGPPARLKTKAQGARPKSKGACAGKRETPTSSDSSCNALLPE